MRRVAVATFLLATACTLGGPATPEPGPGGGPVEVQVSEEPAAGATLVLDLSAEDVDIGSACATIDRWDDGDWTATWWWNRSSPLAERIPDGEEVTCPAAGVAIPTRMTIELPLSLSPGTWRIAWMAGEDLGAYVFEVG